MASLGTILAASAIGQGSGNFVRGRMQGAFDQQRLDQGAAQNAQSHKEWDFKNTEMDRVRQQQQIEDQTPEGETDEDRLNKLAEIAEKGGRGDLSRKYRSAAVKAREDSQLKNIASASRAITLGQFEPATKLLNQTGLFGNIHGIALADDVEQDPSDPTYSVYAAGGVGPDGKPTRGNPVHVTQKMLYALQAKPGDALHWMTVAQAQQGKQEATNRNLDRKDRELDYRNQHWIRADENVLRRIHATGGGGSGRPSDFQIRLAVARKTIGQPGGFADEKAAAEWAQDPNRGTKDNWIALKLAAQVRGDIYTDPKAGSNRDEVVDGIRDVAAEFKKSPIAPHPPPHGAPAPASGAPDFKALGFKSHPSGSWQNPKTGVWFKTDPDGKPLAWSNTKNAWVPVQ